MKMESKKRVFIPIVNELYRQRGPFSAWLFIDACKGKMASKSVPTVRDIKRIMELAGYTAVGKGPGNGPYGKRVILYGPKETKK